MPQIYPNIEAVKNVPLLLEGCLMDFLPNIINGFDYLPVLVLRPFTLLYLCLNGIALIDQCFALLGDSLNLRLNCSSYYTVSFISKASNQLFDLILSFRD